jgi:hypothetical protein
MDCNGEGSRGAADRPDLHGRGIDFAMLCITMPGGLPDYQQE